MNVPSGAAATYAEIAMQVADQKKDARRYARAVGQALGANPMADRHPMPSCHRRKPRPYRLCGRRRHQSLSA